jgi:hypothetical protein
MKLLKEPFKPNLSIANLLRKQTTANPVWSKFV